MDTDVVVVGAGPVGLMLAGELRLGGADVSVYDRLPAATGESRALGFTRRVAEVFDQRGLLDRLGPITWGKQGHFGGVRIDLSMLDESHHGVLGLPQSRTEAMLDDWLTELGVEVRRGYEAVDFRETTDGVTVSFDGPDGRVDRTARYLVGCDGGQSTVRTVAGITASGWEATRGMYMADITGAEPQVRPIGERVPGGNMVLAVGLGDGYYRILVHDKSLPPPSEPDAPTFVQVADAWQRMTGESLHHGSARWTCAFGNAARLASEYRHGRVLLAGDAAHDTPPLAGWGLSVGVQDAVNLGWKLAAVVGGSAPASLLDTYHAERHPYGQQLLRNIAAASLLYLTGDETEPLRVVLRELVDYPEVAAHFAGMVSGLGVRYDMGDDGHPWVGLRLSPDRELVLANGRRARVAELLRPARGVLVDTDGSPEPARRAAAWSDRVDIVTGDWVGSPASGAAGVAGSVLLRPDGHVAWAASGDGDLCAALDRWFGPGRAPAHA